jgi:outer membrane protein, heavy metal efflux system
MQPTFVRLAGERRKAKWFRAGCLPLVTVTLLGCANLPSDDRASKAPPPPSAPAKPNGAAPPDTAAPSDTTGASSGPASGIRQASAAVPDATAPDAPVPEGEHPLDFYVRAALACNPEIQAAERHVAAQSEVVPQVTSLPDPVLSDIPWLENQAPQTAAGRVTNSLILSQQFPWFGKLRLRGEVAGLETKIALTQLADKQLKVIEEVKLAYYDIYYHIQALRVLDESERIFERDFLVPARAGVGKSAKLDMVRAQVELAKLEDRRIELRQRLKQAQASLAKSLSTDPEADLRVAEIPDLPVVPEELERLYEVALISRPELQGRIHAVSQAERLVELARLNYFPDVALGVAWYDLTTDDALSKTANGENSLGIAFSVNLPVWQPRLRAGVREAEDRISERQRLYQAARDDTFRSVRQLTVEAVAEEKQIELLRKQLVPGARQALALAIEGYRAGNVDPVRVVDNWLQLTNTLLELARLETSVGKNIASLERVVGVQLMPFAGPPEIPGGPPT